MTTRLLAPHGPLTRSCAGSLDRHCWLQWYHKMTDVLGCPIVVDATGETALLTLKAPSFVCMGHQKLKVDFDHCHATIGLDPRHGADAKVFHDGVWAGQAEDHVDLVANMVGTSDEAVLRRTLAIKVRCIRDGSSANSSLTPWTRTGTGGPIL